MKISLFFFAYDTS